MARIKFEPQRLFDPTRFRSCGAYLARPEAKKERLGAGLLLLGTLVLVLVWTGGRAAAPAREPARSVDELLDSSHARAVGAPGAGWWRGADLLALVRGLVPPAATPTPALATGRTLRVPQEVATIQGAIEEARAGDTVRVAAGEYRENIRMKDGVSVIGESADTTILDGGQKGNVVTCQDLDDQETRLENFTIRGAGTALGGLLIEDSSLIVNRNIFSGNDYGIYIKGEASPVVQRNVFKENKVGVQVFNLESPRASYPVVNDNLFFTNKKGVSLYRGSALIEHNTLAYNSLSGDSGATFGIYLASASAVIRNNLITNNGTCELCSGIYADADSRAVRIGSNDLWNNRNNYICFGECEMEDTNVSEDPLYQDGLQLDFRLREDAPLRAAGSDKQSLGARL